MGSSASLSDSANPIRILRQLHPFLISGHFYTSVRNMAYGHGSPATFLKNRDLANILTFILFLKIHVVVSLGHH